MLEEKIRNKKATIGVIGLGYIGLPVASYLAAAGFSVKGLDVDAKKIKQIQKGKCPICEDGFDAIFKKALKNLEVSASDHILKGADIFILCVQTPVENQNPDLSFLEKAMSIVSKHLEKDQLVIVESTVSPGTTVRLWDKYGKKDCFVAHCPERVIPGSLCKEFVREERIIGGDEESALLAKALYRHIVKGEIQTTDLTTAEIVKVIENAYRNTNIAFANEVAVICDELGINAFRAIELANKHPRVNVHTPGCGVGGNCIPVAPILLTHNSELKPSVIKTAIETNKYMPQYVVQLVREKKAEGKIIVLGYSYKGDSPDIKETPVKEIVAELKRSNAVEVFDPLVEDMDIHTLEEFYSAAKDADCLLLATNHSMFKKIDFKKVKAAMNRPLVIDGRGFFRDFELEKLGFEYDGIGI